MMNKLFPALLLVVGLLMGGVAAQAQTGTSLDKQLTTWQAVADDASTLIADDTTSTNALESLREILVDQRSAALSAQEANSGRIETLSAQLEALGPAPEEGEVEDTEIAGKRASLENQIAALEAPQKAALAAYNQADGLIQEIDSVVRSRFTDALIERGPSPLYPDPERLSAAGAELLGFFSSLGTEAVNNISDPEYRAEFADRLPLLAALSVLSIALLVVVRQRLSGALIRRAKDSGETAKLNPAIAVSLLAVSRIGIAVVGAALVLWILAESEVFGEVGNWLLKALPASLALGIGYWWLGNSLFAPQQPEIRQIAVDDANARSGKRLAIWAGIIWGLGDIVGAAAETGYFSRIGVAVINLPIVVLGAIVLIRIYALLRGLGSTEDTTPTDDEEDSAAAQLAKPFGQGLLALVVRLATLLSIAAPVLAALGYYAISRYIILPQILSLFLVGVAFLIYKLFSGIVSQLSAAEDGEEKASSDPIPSGLQLAPLLLGFVLACVSVPLLALVWGARVSDLTEVWVMFSEGIAVGETRFTATDFLTFIVIFALGYSLTRMLQGVLRTSVFPKTRMDTGARDAISAGIGYVGIFLAALAAISTTGLDLSNLAIVAGALSVGVGFGLQTVVSNFVSGIILLVERPIKPGDWIEAAGYQGFVRKISVRSTEIDTFDRASVIVPNAELISGTVLNWTHSSMIGRVIAPVGVAYGTDPRRVEKLLMQIAKDHPLILNRPEPQVVFIGFGADSLDFEIRGFIAEVTQRLKTHSDLNFAIAECFEKENIEIPFAQRDIHLRNVPELRDALSEAFHGSKPAQPASEPENDVESAENAEEKGTPEGS